MANTQRGDNQVRKIDAALKFEHQAFQDYLAPHAKLVINEAGQDGRLQSLANSRLFYHYTDAGGLQGIVQNKVLWASNLAYMNDRSEYLYGLRLCLDQIGSIRAEGEYKAVLDILKERLESSNNMNFYSLSLSTRGDQLGQWRAYAADGMGFALGFTFPGRLDDKTAHVDLKNVLAIKDLDVSDQNEAQIRGYFVSYRKDAQKAWIEAILQNYTQALLTKMAGDDWFGGRETVIKDIARFVEYQVSFAALQFKHPAFQEEGEFRIIVHPENIQDEQYEQLPSSCVKVRNSNGSLVPYVELVPCRKWTLDQVITGPDAGGKRAVYAVNALLSNNEYNNLQAVESQIPYV